ncbi:hypothetical protein O9993_06460 [Vibrio lentus]|nr:hypothetical protein [Vibrio lentus]
MQFLFLAVYLPRYRGGWRTRHGTSLVLCLAGYLGVGTGARICYQLKTSVSCWYGTSNGCEHSACVYVDVRRLTLVAVASNG